MEADLGRADLLSDAVPTAAILVVAVLFVALWAASHVFVRRLRDPWLRVGLVVLRLLAAAIAVWSVLQAFGRVVTIGTPWPLWLAGAIGALAVEGVLGLYRLERGIASRALGWSLTALRVLLILMVFFMLMQPVLRRQVARRIERFVAVLLDDSDSMRIVDSQWSVADRLDLAALFAFDSVKGRARLMDHERSMADVQRELAAETHTLNAAAVAAPEAFLALLETQSARLRETIAQRYRPAVDGAVDALAGLAEDKRYPEALRAEAGAMRDKLDDVVRDALRKLKSRVERDFKDGPAAGAKEVGDLIATIDTALTQMLVTLPALAETADKAFYDSFTPEQRQAIDELARQPRDRIARQTLVGKPLGADRSLLETLGADYGVKIVAFAQSNREVTADDLLSAPAPASADTSAPTNGPTDAAFLPAEARTGTDIAGSLESVLAGFPAESLAGVLLLADGRHNAASGVDAVARTLGSQRIPVCVVPIGSAVPPLDAAILNLRSPESVYLGDRVAMRLDLKFDGLSGSSLKVRLLADGADASEQTVKVPEDAHRTTLRFTHTPEARGVVRYAVEMEEPEGDKTPANNRWTFDVAVTDDRTNVLIVEDRPRWEFRYLRNLFFGRDKSVHLQYVLLRPDLLAGAPPAPVVHASAARKFGDAEATALPKNREEWLKFDAIILGDLPPEALNEETVKDLRYCVDERGALLVVIAGPNYMPHAFEDTAWQELLPVRYAPRKERLFESPEPEYRLLLSPSGRTHPIMQMSASATENDQIWSDMPKLHWRCLIEDAKEGANVLAYAEPQTKADDRDLFERRTVSAEEAARDLEAQIKRRSRNALIVEHRFGQGRVLMMNFDRTWRLRYGIGDTFHHRFWGQVLRWGGGENLRSGTEQVRLGTDRIGYAPGQPIQIVSKLIDEQYRPILGAEVFAKVFQGERLVLRRKLSFREGSNGIYEAQIDGLADLGRYRVELESSAAEEILAREGEGMVQTEFNVISTTAHAELAELTVDLGTLNRIAELSGGALEGPVRAGALLERFGQGSRTVDEIREWTLWDRWPLLLAIVGCVTIEWLLRRRASLA